MAGYRQSDVGRQAIRTIDVDGTTYRIMVNESGKFSVDVGSEEDGNADELTDDVLNSLIVSLRAWARKSKLRLALPVSVISESREWASSKPKKLVIRDATLTGQHTRTGRLLVRWLDTNKAETLERYNVTVGLRMTDDQKAQLRVDYQGMQDSTARYEGNLASVSRDNDTLIEEAKKARKETQKTA